MFLYIFFQPAKIVFFILYSIGTNHFKEHSQIINIGSQKKGADLTAGSLPIHKSINQNTFPCQSLVSYTPFPAVALIIVEIRH